jgi:hypothetical protein
MIGRKKESREIAGLKYDVTQLGGIDAGDVLLRLTKCIGPSVGALTDPSLSAVFEKLSLTPEDMAYFREKFGPQSRVHLADGKSPRIGDCYDDHFAGRTGAALEWFRFCIEVNYSDFLGDVLRKIDVARKQTTTLSPLKSPKASTGSPGDSSPTSDSESLSES